MQNADPNRKPDDKNPEGKSGDGLEAPSIGVALRSLVIMGAYFLLLSVAAELLPQELNIPILLWVIAGVFVVARRIERDLNLHTAKVVTDMASGWRFFVMAIFWPMLLKKSASKS